MTVALGLQRLAERLAGRERITWEIEAPDLTLNADAAAVHVTRTQSSRTHCLPLLSRILVIIALLRLYDVGRGWRRWLSVRSKVVVYLNRSKAHNYNNP